jgi:hypothetical protein
MLETKAESVSAIILFLMPIHLRLNTTKKRTKMKRRRKMRMKSL